MYERAKGFERKLNMADYNFTCEKCGEECFVDFDYDMATASNDGGNLEFTFEYTCTGTGPNGTEDECGAEYMITVYALVHSHQVDPN